MTHLDLAYPFLGLSVLVTVGLLGWSMWVFWTTPPEEARILPKRGRLVYRVGLAATVLSVAITLGLVAWTVGRTILGGW